VAAPFHFDQDHVGSAGFVRVLSDGRGFRGAMLVVSPLGEPLDLSYGVDDAPGEGSVRRLVAALVEACPRTPDVLLGKAGEVDQSALNAGIPAARVAGQAVEWCGSAPPAASSALVERLARTGLLHEPFERAAIGLAIVLEPGSL
jgi:hypothetical protein